MDYTSAASLLWAHQLKRENHHLLQRIETLERNARHTSAPLSQEKNASSPETFAATTISNFEARLKSLEDAAQSHRQFEASTGFVSQLAALESTLDDLSAGLDRRVRDAARSLQQTAGLAERLNSKVATLDVEVAADALAVKRASDGVEQIQAEAERLGERVWGVENGVANLESGRREDRVRIAAAAKELNEAKQKIERVFSVVEVLIDRDEEVHGRVGELEAWVKNAVAGRAQHEKRLPIDLLHPTDLQLQEKQRPLIERTFSQATTQDDTAPNSPLAKPTVAQNRPRKTPQPRSKHHAHNRAGPIEQPRSKLQARIARSSGKRRKAPDLIVPANRTRSQTKAAAAATSQISQP